jgi:hypothetical protein
LAAIATAAALVAGATLASADLTSDTDRTTIAPGETGVATAKCSRGSEAVSGGFNSPGFASGANGIYTYASKRAGERKAKALGEQTEAPAARLTAYVYCDGSEPGLKTRTASAPVNFFEDVSVTARCPRNSEAIWGGFASPGVPADDLPILTIGSSRKGKRRWTVSGVSFADTEPLTLKAFVYCDKSEPGLVVRTKSTLLDADESGRATARCRRGSEAVSGGYFAPGGFDPDVGSEIYFRESHRVGKREWTASGTNSGDPDARLTAVAYCR